MVGDLRLSNNLPVELRCLITCLSLGNYLRPFSLRLATLWLNREQGHLLTYLLIRVKHFLCYWKAVLQYKFCVWRCRFEVNFGQREPWFAPPMPGFKFIDNLPVQNRVRGMLSPPRKVDCEVITGFIPVFCHGALIPVVNLSLWQILQYRLSNSQCFNAVDLASVRTSASTVSMSSVLGSTPNLEKLEHTTSNCRCHLPVPTVSTICNCLL